MMKLHLCNKIFYLVTVYLFFNLCFAHCITYVCEACVVSVFFVSCHVCSWLLA